MRRAARVFSVAAVVGLVAACGGSTVSEIFDPVDASTVAPDGAVITPDGAVVAPDGAVIPPDAAVEPDSAVISPDGAVIPPDGAVITPDGAVPPGNSPARLACGVFTCAIPGETCCVARGGGGAFTYGCAAGACPTTGGGNAPTALKCRGAANCGPGTVCCVTQNNGLTASACKASCGGNDAQLCDPAATPTGCRGGEPCSSNNIGDWRLPANYATCGGKGN